MAPVILIVKIGTSSLTDDHGHIQATVIEKLCHEVAAARADGHQVIIVTSGAIAAGLPALGYDSGRPKDARTLQAASAVGQTRLMAVYEQALARDDIVAGQILLAPLDFFERSQYLHARGTLDRLLELGVVPVVNENDAVADDAIRFGDNDRIAALVGHLVGADKLVLLTDIEGLYSADPRSSADARLIEEITSVTEEIPAEMGGAGTDRGSGGMASKVQAAKIAAYSGVTTVITKADRPHALQAAIEEWPGTGTIIRPQPRPLPARKLWIAFAVEALGSVTVDHGAKGALERDGRSLLAVGVREVTGEFGRGEPVDVLDPDGTAFARGLAAVSADELRAITGVRNAEHPEGTPEEVIHRDSLVLLK